MSSGQGSSSAHAPESEVKGETSGTGLGPSGQHHDGTSTTNSIMATEKWTSIPLSRSLSNLKPCDNSSYIGIYCNISKNMCHMSEPCQNGGTCHSNSFDTFNCSCPTGFNGTKCEHDHRICKRNTCLNNGTCNETLNGTFHCTCKPGWEGVNCESRINLCIGVVCLNNGKCQSLLLNYTCFCLNDGYSGRHCEIIHEKTICRKNKAKLIVYIPVFIIGGIIVLVIGIRILKDCCGIDLIRRVQLKYRRRRQAKRITVHPSPCDKASPYLYTETL